MSVFGIVSEFNPFHLGHEYLIRCARDMGADSVVSVMSGNATQRGELAITDKYTRAEAALCGGADLVLELPFPWSSASAESFALAGISVLNAFCDTVIFGSECGNIELLKKIADFTSSHEFKQRYSELLASGEQSAASYISLIKEISGTELSSNDLLGIEYIKAAKTLRANLNFVTVKRAGSAYRESAISDNGFDSAMAIRSFVREENDLDILKERLPARSCELLFEAKKNGRLFDADKYGDAVIMHFRLFRGTDNCSFAESEGGVLERIINVAHESTSADDFWKSLFTKRYTDAKLRRAVLFAMCEVVFDSVILCMLTGFAILLSVDNISAFSTPMSLVSAAFSSSLGNFSVYILLILVFAFAYATLICWYFYGIECSGLYFPKIKPIYPFLFLFFVLISRLINSKTVLYVTDFLLLLMTVMTLSAIIKRSKKIAEISLKAQKNPE